MIKKLLLVIVFVLVYSTGAYAYEKFDGFYLRANSFGSWYYSAPKAQGKWVIYQFEIGAAVRNAHWRMELSPFMYSGGTEVHWSIGWKVSIMRTFWREKD